MVDRESVFQPGDLCDKYRVVALLATGGQAEVYRAQHEVMEREVALKVVRAPLADRDDVRQRLKQEARLLGRIQHPGIVTVYDAGITPTGVIYIAMELLDGQTLHHALRAVRKVPVPQALQICASIGDALEAAHELGIVHRDVKPANVFVTGKNAVKIVDLGTAKLFHAGLKTSRADAVVGTLWYMAPEQVLKNSGTPQSDIYAVGLMLYEMIAGRHAFADEDSDTTATKFQIGMRQLYESPPALTEVIPGFPSYVWDLVSKATQKEPADRFGSMLEFATEARNQRRRFVDEVKAHGIVPGVVDLTQRPPSEPAGPERDSETTTVETAVPAGFTTEPLDPALVASMISPVHDAGTPADSTPASAHGQAVEAPRTPTPALPAEAAAVAVPLKPVRIVAVNPTAVASQSQAHVEPDASNTARSEVSPVSPPASPPRISLFDEQIHRRDFDSGMHVIANLPDADAVKRAIAVLGSRTDPNVTFAVGCAIAAIPRAYGAYALALSRAIVDLVDGQGTVQRTAAEFVLEAVQGYMPHCQDLIPADLVIPEVSGARKGAPVQQPGASNPRAVETLSPAVAPGDASAAVEASPVVVARRSNFSSALAPKHVIGFGAVLGVVVGVSWVLMRGSSRTEARADESSPSATAAPSAASLATAMEIPSARPAATETNARPVAMPVQSAEPVSEISAPPRKAAAASSSPERRPLPEKPPSDPVQPTAKPAPKSKLPSSGL